MNSYFDFVNDAVLILFSSCTPVLLNHCTSLVALYAVRISFGRRYNETVSFTSSLSLIHNMRMY